jgi:hypothetical protein
MTREFERSLLKTASGWAALSACSTGEVAHEDPDFRQGVFTYYFCEALTQPPPGSTMVTLEGAVDRVKTSMATWCDLKMRKQTPQFKSDISGILDLSHVSPASSPAEIKEEPPDPIREFYQRLDQHRDSTPSSTQQFSFTNQTEHDRIAEQFFSLSKDAWEKFDYAAISVTIGDPKPLQHFAQTWAALHAALWTGSTWQRTRRKADWHRDQAQRHRPFSSQHRTRDSRHPLQVFLLDLAHNNIRVTNKSRVETKGASQFNFLRPYATKRERHGSAQVHRD